MTLTVKPVSGATAGSGVAVFDPSTMSEEGLSEGTYVQLVGPDGDEAVARVRAGGERGGAGAVRIDRDLRRALGVGIGDEVTVTPTAVTDAERVTLSLPDLGEPERLSFRDALVERAILAGQSLRVALGSGADSNAGYTADRRHRYPVHVVETEPEGPVVVREWTSLTVAGEQADDETGTRSVEEPTRPSSTEGDRPPSRLFSRRRVGYDDIGGLDAALEQVRETVELPIEHPAVFERFGIDPPTGVLIHGPPGTGKTLIARAIAHETDIHVESISGPTIVSKYAGETESRLREVFEAASNEEAAIVFIDELDTLAGKRDGAESEGRVVAQLISSMDAIERGDRTVVVATTNAADEIDPALRRGGRFDREVEISVPDRDGREAILEIHARSIPLADDVDLGTYAERTHGFVGADLENLLRESAMCAIRRLGDRQSDTTGGPTDLLGDAAAVVRAVDLDNALRTTEPSALREVFVEVPEVSWADVGGLDEVKARLQESVQWPLAYAEAFERVALRPPTGILLYGAPGTGKTLLAKAVANEADSNFISIKGPELLDKYVGESEKGVREVFAKARENAPTVVFFDEIDAIATERGSGTTSGVTERVVSQLLTELDGLEDLKDVVVVATTNRPGLVDDALLRPGRFDRHIHVGAPDEAARREILAVHTNERPLDADVDLDALAARTDGYVGADIESVCREAATAAVRSHVTTGGPVDDIVLTAAHFETALAEIEASGVENDRFGDFEARVSRD